MKYDTPYKTRKLWKQVNQNEINVNKLKKLNIISHSLSYSKNIHTYPTSWASWLTLPAYPTLTIIELRQFPKRILPYLEANLITKTEEYKDEDKKGIPNEEYIKDLTDRILFHYSWHYTYTIKAELITEGKLAEEYKIKYDKKIEEIELKHDNGLYETEEEYQADLKKAEDDRYPIIYYLISYISLWFHNSRAEPNRINYPLDYKQIITINAPKFDEVRTNKS